MNLAAKIAVFFLAFILISPISAEPLRSLDEIFPNLSQNQKKAALSNEGLKRSFEKNSSPQLIPDPDLGIDLVTVVMEKKPSHIIEAILVVPYTGRELNRLDAYNAIGRIKNVKDHLYFSGVQNNGIVIFKDSTRLESAKKRNPISDPPPAPALPFSETVYMRFEDASYGTLYLRGNVFAGLHGITYDMTNFAAVRFLFFPIMKEEKFSAIVYIEPVREGVLVYGMSGIYIPGIVAGRINVSSDIEKRFTVLVSWLTDGLNAQAETR